MLQLILLRPLFLVLQESISTCRFAQRVALIKNEATLNEEFDPKLVRGASVTISFHVKSFAPSIPYFYYILNLQTEPQRGAVRWCG